MSVVVTDTGPVSEGHNASNWLVVCAWRRCIGKTCLILRFDFYNVNGDKWRFLCSLQAQVGTNIGKDAHRRVQFLIATNINRAHPNSGKATTRSASTSRGVVIFTNKFQVTSLQSLTKDTGQTTPEVFVDQRLCGGKLISIDGHASLAQRYLANQTRPNPTASGPTKYVAQAAKFASSRQTD